VTGRHQPEPPAHGRRLDIDWLRAGAVYLLLLYHSARPFDSEDWHVKDAHPSVAVDLMNGAIGLWHMPLLFTLAGWSLEASLERRGTSGVLRERRERVLVPFAFGCVALIPLCAYVEGRHKGELDSGFLEYLPAFFTSLDQFTWMHLWFLIYLYVFTLLYLPALRRLHERRPRIERVPAWVPYAAIVPLVAVQVALRGRWPGYQNLYDDWANFALYSLFLIAGFLLACFPAIERAVHDERRRAACAGAAAVLAHAVLTGGGKLPAGSPRWVAAEALTAVAGACVVMALLGYGAKLLAGRERGLGFARDSAMPVYVLHQPLIILLAVPTVALPAGAAVKLPLLVATSTTATLGAYLLVRRSRTLRQLLGARVGPRAESPRRSGAASRSPGRAARTRARLRPPTRRTRASRGSGPAA
jgi:surface polysaccharide O-acyltransferase-like enzyme